jgi:hypothetical protein
MGRDGVFLALFVGASLVAWGVIASRTRHRDEPGQDLTDHLVHVVETSHREDSEDRLLVAMCTQCEWNEVSNERDVSAQEHDLRHKARRHTHNVGTHLISVDPTPVDESAPPPWTPGRFYTYLSLVTHRDTTWRARWLNKDEEPGVSAAWQEAV